MQATVYPTGLLRVSFISQQALSREACDDCGNETADTAGHDRKRRADERRYRARFHFRDLPWLVPDIAGSARRRLWLAQETRLAQAQRAAEVEHRFARGVGRAPAQLARRALTVRDAEIT